jgi:hypothetical protein
VDVHISALKEALKGGAESTDASVAKWVAARVEFVMVDELVHFVEDVRDGADRSTRLRIAVPLMLKEEVKERYHPSMLEGGHFGALRTMGSIARQYWWPRLYSDVKEFVSSCITCQTVGKTGVQRAIIGGHVVGTSPFEYMAMDLLAMPHSTEGSGYILVMMDFFSRYAITVAVPDKQAETIARAFINHVVLIHGPPQKLLSDNEGEFRNQLMSEICRMLETHKSYTSPYNAQCDGMVERFNRTVLKCLATYVRPDQSDWQEYLAWVTFVYNTTASTATNR